ncbi:MAG: hypothetical protein WEB52_12725 [Dehalococcoidia bacterium]
MTPARMALRIDALFELALATLVVVAAATGVDVGEAFALNEWLVIVIGIALVPVGVGLWLAKPDRPTLLTIGVANAVGAVAFAVYLALRGGEMNGYGLAVVTAAVVGLVALAVAELSLARDAGRHAFVS